MGFWSKIIKTKAISSSNEDKQRQGFKRTIGGRSDSMQLAVLNTQDLECFENLKRRWQESYPGEPFDDRTILLFAQCAPAGSFNEASAWKTMNNYERRYLSLTANGLRKQLLTKTLFTLPGLETKDGNEVFYMKPSRYSPKKTPVEDIIDNLVYVMGVMNEKENNAANGIAFLANMNDWTMEHFSMDYCYNFMMMLQGKVPTRVTHFLIVNPPAWFGKVWAIMRGMLIPSFRRRVKMIREDKLAKYLKEGYQAFLPSEMASGCARTREIVRDFVDERRYIESTRSGAHSSSTRKEPSEAETENTTQSCPDSITSTRSMCSI